jgi:arylformamidase
MTGIDYEAQYNNRARHPEHPAIIEGWARDAAAYRTQHPPTTMAYGGRERQQVDLFPASGGEPAAALAVFIHGGYWQALDRSYFSHLARGLNARGVSVAIPSYSLCPSVSVGDIIDEMRLCIRALAACGAPVVAIGHSAGGHLAACMLATDWKSVDAALPDSLVGAAYAISGLFDLRPLAATSINRALGLTETDAGQWSPLNWPAPTGRTLDAVVGGDESAEYLRQSRTIAERWGKAGVAARFEAVLGANHFTVIAPLADPESLMTRRVAELARRP